LVSTFSFTRDRELFFVFNQPTAKRHSSNESETIEVRNAAFHGGVTHPPSNQLETRNWKLESRFKRLTAEPVQWDKQINKLKGGIYLWLMIW
jgi:hypothetical protein